MKTKICAAGAIIFLFQTAKLAHISHIGERFTKFNCTAAEKLRPAVPGFPVASGPLVLPKCHSDKLKAK